jgi:hypothetical protein
MTSKLAKLRGTVRHGEMSEKTGLLGTFCKADKLSIRYSQLPSDADTFLISITRYMWQTWTGNLSRADFVALLAELPNAEVYGAFANTPTLAALGINRV